MDIFVYSDTERPTPEERKGIVDFLYENLEEFGDPRPDIDKAVAYALKETKSFGGFILKAVLDGKIVGVVVVNRTGMKDYIPENILVYIATHKEYRGQGIGKALMKKASRVSDGDIALHVEPDNPARFLYEKMGFTSKYVEMRLHKDEEE
ncbi:MAG TPA: GNAT family N-acetyltransferase [Candidatus Mcinerneyibacteriales bacterium]|nr:GNAT family N-acetyltransferase [Candidatus Mcinerneyibacteriales bacterium]HPE20457.1 GNAT family N-acetyltransferase [Candidatus Mcinerneyibacteriales bacterium]HPJ70023.1 GNAT family N-acetyltransferase [Candidatus Mcinerneyibacteriales bacterium]HPQ88544.1 GNAT family N-acetyltransferase [Candidatus Mcinerneyibacteriales bacterium]